MKIYLIALVMMICSVNSCKKNDSVGSGTMMFPDTIIPLKVNNEWNYSYQRYNYLNEVTYTSDTTLAISKDTIMFGLRRYKFNTFSSLFYDQAWYNQSTEGFQVVADLPGFKDSIVYFPYPPKLGYVYGLIKAYKWKITSIDTSIITPAGVYTCIVYRYDHLVAPVEYYVCPGVGIIKINEWYMTNPGEKNYPGFRLNEVYTLKSFSLK